MTDKIKTTAYYVPDCDVPVFWFIIIKELPEDQRGPFTQWLAHDDTPVIFDDMSIDCAYSWDYELWYDYYIKGEIAPKD